jgi:hypothetical protein
MEGVGHGPMIERPVESAELVLSFINKVTQGLEVKQEIKTLAVQE